MIDVTTLEQLSRAIRRLRADHARGMGTMDLIRSLDIDPITELRAGDWRGTNFATCDLRGVDLSECRLAYCDFTNADVEGAVFYGSDLYRSTLHRALNVTLAYLSDAQLFYLDECRGRDAESESDEGTVFNINQRIRAATSFDRAMKQFSSILNLGMQPDPYSAGLLMGRAQNPRQAWEAFAMIETTDCEVNDVVFTVFASKMTMASDVRAVMNIMGKKGIVPGSKIYNTLLSRTKHDEELMSIVQEMKNESIGLDNVTYDILMRRVNFVGRKSLLNHLVTHGLHPGTAELNILLRDAGSEEQADEAIEIANELEIRRNAETYALLAPHKARPGAFRTLLDDMIEDDLDRDSDFYTLAISRTKSFGDACFLFGRMARDRAPANARIYERLVQLAGVPTDIPDSAEPNQSEQAIAALIRRVGTPTDIIAAGLGGEPGAKPH
jgi:hypothetical protein